MKARLSNTLILMLLIFVVACTQKPEVVVPTLAVLPSATATNTLTDTLTPTWTLTPTITPTDTDTPTITPTDTATTAATLTPSDTLTPSLTPSDTPTWTYTPTPTLTPSLTDTYTITPSDTPTLTPTATLTPTVTASFTPIPTVTPPGPQIISFGANMLSVLANTQITLAWIAQADSTHLDELNAQGAVITSVPVFPTGQQIISVPGNLGSPITFRLVAARNGIEASQSIAVTIACQFGWFFGQQYAPQNAGCATAPITSDGRYQTFERGLMIYVSANGLNHVYGLQFDGSLYIGYVNGWDGTTVNSTAAPSGRFMPQEMFNWAYYNTLAPIGSWNSALGWGTAAIVTQSRTIQWENSIGGSNPFYIDAPDGAIYRFSGGDSGTWSRLR